MTGKRYKIDKNDFEKAWKKNDGIVSAVARDLNASRDAINLRMKRWGYKKTNTRIKKHLFNEHYLDQIDQHQKAFWLGYLFANSYLGLHSTRTHTITISTNRERQLLYNLIRDLNGTHNIELVQNVYLTSNHFAEVLISYGKGYKWKSKGSPTIYPEIEDAYQLYFIHGWIRGNSSCRLDNRTNKRILSISSGEPGVLQNIRDFIGIGGSLKERSQKNGWELIYGGAKQIAHLESLGIQLPSKEFIKKRRLFW